MKIQNHINSSFIILDPPKVMLGAIQDCTRFGKFLVTDFANKALPHLPQLCMTMANLPKLTTPIGFGLSGISLYSGVKGLQQIDLQKSNSKQIVASIYQLGIGILFFSRHILPSPEIDLAIGTLVLAGGICQLVKTTDFFRHTYEPKREIDYANETHSYLVPSINLKKLAKGISSLIFSVTSIFSASQLIGRAISVIQESTALSTFDVQNCKSDAKKGVMRFLKSHSPRNQTDLSITNTKIQKGTQECDYRIQHDKELQEKRWQWVKENPEEYLALLKKGGISEQSIDGLKNGNFPLGFENKTQYEHYKTDLENTFKHISTNTGVTGFRVIQQGSYVTGYSSNPRKGLREIPTHIFSSDSDLDLRITAKNIDSYVDSLSDKIETKDHYRDLIEPNQLEKIFSELQKFTETWAEKLGRKLQITIAKSGYQNFSPNVWDEELCFD